jgi:hypothetical protein
VYLRHDLQMASEAASVLSGAAPRNHLREAFALVLQGIGVTPARAWQLCVMDLPLVELPTGFGPSGLHAALQIKPGKRTKSLR